MNKQIRNKFFGIAISFILMLNCLCNSLLVKAQDEVVYSRQVVDGIEYTISTYNEDGITHVTVHQSNSQDYVDLSLSDDNEELVKKEYNYIGTDIFGDVKYDSSSEVVYLDNERTMDSEVEALGITWNSKTYEKWEGDYWYKKGNDGRKVYYQIGCTATYQIRVDNSSSNKDACEKYSNEIKECNKHYVIGSAALDGTAFGVGFITGLIIANAAFPPSVIVDVILGIIGAGAIGTAVVELVNAYSSYCNIKDYYVDARACGIKL